MSLAIWYLILLGCIIYRGTNGAFIKHFNKYLDNLIIVSFLRRSYRMKSLLNIFL